MKLRKRTKIISILLSILCLFSLFITITSMRSRSSDYDNAVALYQSAYSSYARTASEYANSLKLAVDVAEAINRYGESVAKLNSALKSFSALGRFRDTLTFISQADITLEEIAQKREELKLRTDYLNAVSLFEEGKYNESYPLFNDLIEYPVDLLPTNFSTDGLDSSALTCDRLARESKYRYALELFKTEEYELAFKSFAELEGYSDSETLLANAQLHFMPEIQKRVYDEAVQLMKSGEYSEALDSFERLVSYNYAPAAAKAEECRAILKRNALAQTFVAGSNFVLAIQPDGAIKSTHAGLQSELKVDKWQNLVSIAAGGAEDGENDNPIVIGLTADGGIVVTSRYNTWKNHMQNKTILLDDIDSVSGVVQVTAGFDHMAILLSNGKVISAGVNSTGQCNTDAWENIVSIAAAADITVGLTSDGKVVTTAAISSTEVNTWSDIVAVSAGGGRDTDGKSDLRHIVALTSTGKVLTAGSKNHGQHDAQTEWEAYNIVAVSAGLWHTIGLTDDGIALISGGKNIANFEPDRHEKLFAEKSKVAAVSAGYGYCLILSTTDDKTGQFYHAGYDDKGQPLPYTEKWQAVIYPEWQRFRTDNAFRDMVLSVAE